MRKIKRRCRICRAVHWYAADRCQSCGKRGVVMPSEGLGEVIAAAVHGDDKPKQRTLFDE